jgi:hypothetical protein
MPINPWRLDYNWTVNPYGDTPLHRRFSNLQLRPLITAKPDRLHEE